MSYLTISPLEQKDIPEAVEVLSDAMLGVPLHTTVFQGRAQEARRELRHMSEELVHDPAGVIWVAKLDEQVVGVLRMKWCLGRYISDLLADEAVLRDTVSRVAYWQSVWARHDPREPHWHLGPVGILPSHQHSGTGTALLQRFCGEMDARQTASYFETDRPWLVPFCQKFGFQLVDEADIFGVKNYFMWRAPQS